MYHSSGWYFALQTPATLWWADHLPNDPCLVLKPASSDQSTWNTSTGPFFQLTQMLGALDSLPNDINNGEFFLSLITDAGAFFTLTD